MMVMMPGCLISDDCARQELAKWQADRDTWAETLPVMSFFSQFLMLSPITDRKRSFHDVVDLLHVTQRP